MTPAMVKRWRDVPVVLGGPHPSVLPDESLKGGSADIVVRGEGEATWRAIGDVLAANWTPGTEYRASGSGLWASESGPLGRIGGISYRLPDGPGRP